MGEMEIASAWSTLSEGAKVCALSNIRPRIVRFPYQNKPTSDANISTITVIVLCWLTFALSGPVYAEMID